jgi:hypothetical protein
MDMMLVGQFIKDYGVAVTGCILLFWLVIYWTCFAQKRLIIWLDKQTEILVKQATTVEGTSVAVKLVADALTEICALVKELIVLVKGLKT